ncbi:MAG: hypothetical protein JNN28_09360, partial [Saprospiraceae bacterium]|nr:hypothetical protein [Saprospiraceae bacterium]
MKKSARFNKRQNYGAILFLIAFTPLLQAQSPVLPADSTFSNLLPELIIQDRKTELIGFAHWKVDSLPTAIATTLAERLL